MGKIPAWFMIKYIFLKYMIYEDYWLHNDKFRKVLDLVSREFIQDTLGFFSLSYSLSLSLLFFCFNKKMVLLSVNGFKLYNSI